MRKILFLLLIFFAVQPVLSQTQAYKYDSFEQIYSGSCDIQFRLSSFSYELSKKPQSKGLIVIYTGRNEELFGNVSEYAKNVLIGINLYFKVPTERISVIFLEGKQLFAQEFWIIPQNSEPPFTESFQFDWSTVLGNYHFSRSCLTCEPNYPVFSFFNPNFEQFAEILKTYPHYQGRIYVTEFSELIKVKRELTVKHKLSKTRFKIYLKKKDPENQNSYFVDLFLVNSGKS